MSDLQWSQMSPRQLLDLAQVEMEKFLADPHDDDRTMYRGYPLAKYKADALLAAAQVQSIENLTWTLDERLIPSLGRQA